MIVCGEFQSELKCPLYYYYHYIQLYSIKDRLAKTAATFLVDYILRFGIPDQLLSDQDPAYESHLFQELIRGLGVKKLRTTGYNPRSNGLTEQANATVKPSSSLF